eukprot:2901305-Pyramimonas_sp.AAC.1
MFGQLTLKECFREPRRLMTELAKQVAAGTLDKKGFEERKADYIKTETAVTAKMKRPAAAVPKASAQKDEQDQPDDDEKDQPDDDKPDQKDDAQEEEDESSEEEEVPARKKPAAKKPSAAAADEKPAEEKPDSPTAEDEEDEEDEEDPPTPVTKGKPAAHERQPLTMSSEQAAGGSARKRESDDAV